MRTTLSFKKIKNILVEPALLLISFFAAMTVAPIFQLPFSNPHNISNPFNVNYFNPSNNYIALAFIIVATLGLFVLLRKLYAGKYAWIIKIVAICILLSNFFIFNMLDITTGYFQKDIIYANGSLTLDNFHAGEQLAPANAFLNGEQPYRDIFFLRGAGVDVIVPAIGFVVFGKTIGSFLLVTHIFMLLTMIGFFMLLWLVVKGTLRYVGVITLFFIADSLSMVQIRYLPVWIVLGLVIYFFQSKVSDKYKRVILIAIGVLASLELYIAIDQGILLCVLAALMGISLLLFSPNKKNVYSFTPRIWRTRIKYPLYIIGGLVVGLGIPAIFLGWHSFTIFLQMTFLDIPRFAGLLVSSQFPTLFAPDNLVWGPVIIAIAAGFILIKLWTPSVHRNLTTLIPYTLIFIFGFLSIKAGANRISVDKMAQVDAPLYFISFAILSLAIYVAYKYKSDRLTLIVPIAILLVTYGVFAQLNPEKLLHQPRYTRAEVSRYVKMPSSPDSYWVSSETQKVSEYIKEHTSKSDHIFVFPSNPSMYYLTDRMNSTRFYISWYADPQPYTNQLLADLKKNPPSIVVYEEKTWMDAPDGVDMKTRLPEVSEWLLANYPKRVVVGNTTLLQK